MTQNLPVEWASIPIAAVCEINPRSKSGLGLDDDVTFLPMAAVSEVSGTITAPETRKLSEVQKGFTSFQEGDVLFAKITPCMENGKAAIARGLVNQRGYGSTEFHVLRPGPLVLAEWIFFLVRTESFRRAAASTFQGAVGQQRVSADFMQNFRIPLPPLSEQQRIVEILQEAEAIRRLRTQAEAKTAELIPAMFSAMFGNVSSTSKRWPVVPVSSFVESFEGGKSLSGVEGDGDTTRPRVLKISAVTSGRLVADESKALPSSYEPPEEHYVRSGDLLITRANTEELVGATALIGDDVPPNVVLPDKIWRFVWKEDFEGSPEFIWSLFQDRATRRALGGIATGTGGSMKNISMAKLMQMRVALPPPEKQREFAKVLREMTALAEDHRGASLTKLLEGSVSAHSFSASLTAVWREVNEAKLGEEIQARDAALASTMGRRAKMISGSSFETTRSTATIEFSPAIRDLTREQRGLLEEIRRLVTAGHFKPYLTAEALAAQMGASPLRRNPQMVEGHLAVLAARGFLIPVSREEQTPDTGEYVFGNAWRLSAEPVLIIPGNHDVGDVENERTRHTLDRSKHSIRLRELERLAAKIEKERALP